MATGTGITWVPSSLPPINLVLLPLVTVVVMLARVGVRVLLVVVVAVVVVASVVALVVLLLVVVVAVVVGVR